jgi:2-iminobutanoate/2-iminopropanoate deaminase
MNSPAQSRTNGETPDPANMTGPAPLANYAVVELENGLILLPGQGCRDPLTNKCVGITWDSVGSVINYDIREQIAGVFRNIEALLLARGLSKDNIVDVTVYLKNKADFDAMNKMWDTYFKDCPKPPARTTIFVADLPGDNFVEMKVMASRVGRVD